MVGWWWWALKPIDSTRGIFGLLQLRDAAAEVFRTHHGAGAGRGDTTKVAPTPIEIFGISRGLCYFYTCLHISIPALIGRSIKT